MNYQQALEYISSTYKLGMKKGTENISKLLELLDNPQLKVKVIHVAGTNGKGSTCSFIANTLMKAGYRTGLYTSPYLEVFNERIRVDGKNIPDEELAQIVTTIKEKTELMVSQGFDHPTEFEVTTAAGFMYFAQQDLDYLVLEVGLGGRHDATNVIPHPIVTVITSISIDHVDQLGDKIDGIAYEKAGIIKDNAPLILYPQAAEAKEVILKEAKLHNAPVYMIDPADVNIKSTSLYGQVLDMKVLDTLFEDIKISLIGEHQSKNALTAATAVKLLNDLNLADVSDETIRKGLLDTKWAGRLELLKKNPITIIDGAHNEEGASALAKAVTDYLKEYHVTLVFGMLKDKDVDKVLSILLPVVDHVIITTPNNERAMKAEDMAVKIKAYGTEHTLSSSIKDAVEKGLQIRGDKEAVVYAGSLYMIGEVRTLLNQADI